jgi:hypothetical protein
MPGTHDVAGLGFNRGTSFRGIPRVPAHDQEQPGAQSGRYLAKPRNHYGSIKMVDEKLCQFHQALCSCSPSVHCF